MSYSWPAVRNAAANVVVCTEGRNDHATLSGLSVHAATLREDLAAMEKQIQFNPNDNELENDWSNMRRFSRHLLSGSCICRNLYRFPLRLRWRPNLIWRTNEPKRDDRSAPF